MGLVVLWLCNCFAGASAALRRCWLAPPPNHLWRSRRPPRRTHRRLQPSGAATSPSTERRCNFSVNLSLHLSLKSLPPSLTATPPLPSLPACTAEVCEKLHEARDTLVARKQKAKM